MKVLVKDPGNSRLFAGSVACGLFIPWNPRIGG